MQSLAPTSKPCFLIIDPETRIHFALRLRIPGKTFKINGTAIALPKKERGYVAIECEWKSGDENDLHLAMPAERVYAHPARRDR